MFTIASVYRVTVAELSPLELVLAGTALSVALAIFLAAAMPERGFRPVPAE